MTKNGSCEQAEEHKKYKKCDVYRFFCEVSGVQSVPCLAFRLTEFCLTELRRPGRSPRPNKWCKFSVCPETAMFFPKKSSRFEDSMCLWSMWRMLQIWSSLQRIRPESDVNRPLCCDVVSINVWHAASFCFRFLEQSAFCDIFCVFHMLRRRLSSGAAANFSSSSFKFANRFSKSRQSSQNIHCINHNHHKSHAKPHHGGKSRSGICESPCNLQSKLTQITNSPLHLFWQRSKWILLFVPWQLQQHGVCQQTSSQSHSLSKVRCSYRSLQMVMLNDCFFLFLYHIFKNSVSTQSLCTKSTKNCFSSAFYFMFSKFCVEPRTIRDPCPANMVKLATNGCSCLWEISTAHLQKVTFSPQQMQEEDLWCHAAKERDEREDLTKLLQMRIIPWHCIQCIQLTMNAYMQWLNAKLRRCKRKPCEDSKTCSSLGILNRFQQLHDTCC